MATIQETVQPGATIARSNAEGDLYVTNNTTHQGSFTIDEDPYVIQAGITITIPMDGSDIHFTNTNNTAPAVPLAITWDDGN